MSPLNRGRLRKHRYLSDALLRGLLGGPGRGIAGVESICEDIEGKFVDAEEVSGLGSGIEEDRLELLAIDKQHHRAELV